MMLWLIKIYRMDPDVLRKKEWIEKKIYDCFKIGKIVKPSDKS